jgi:hypothetical protein
MTEGKDVFKEYFGEDNLRLAFERYKRTADGDAKDHSGIKIFQSNLDENIKDLSLRLIDNQYDPIKPLKFYIPKKTKGSIRTYTLLYVEEAIVFQSIADKIACENFLKLNQVNNSVFSYRLHDEVSIGLNLIKDEDAKFYFFQRWHDLYKQFSQLSANQIADTENQYRLATDVSGFYDTILHNLLFEKLRNNFNVPNEIIAFLESLLNVFSGTPKSLLKGVGLPQGPQPSHFFAQLFLYDFDLSLIDKGFSSYFRYVDDIHIYSLNEEKLVSTKSYIERKLKEIGLYMNSKKTDIKNFKSKESRAIESKKILNKITEYQPSNILEIIDGKMVITRNSNNAKITYDEAGDLMKSNHLDDIDDQLPKQKSGNIKDHIKDQLEQFILLTKDVLVEKDNGIWLRNEKKYELKISDSEYKQAITDLKRYFRSVSLLKQDTSGVFLWETEYLDIWISLFRDNPYDESYLNILSNFYRKGSELKNKLLSIYDEFYYLEWVRHKIALILSNVDFDYSKSELSIIYQSYYKNLTHYECLSFYLIFMIHLNPDDSLFSTIVMRISNDEMEKQLFIKEWIVFRMDYNDVSVKKILEVKKNIGYE